MGQIKNTKINSTSTLEAATQAPTVEVLYQKLGNRWYAFSLVDEEVFVGSLSQEEIDGKATPITTPANDVTC
jgi:hypothetical protein